MAIQAGHLRVINQVALLIQLVAIVPVLIVVQLVLIGC